MKSSVNVYSISLHVALAGLGAAVLLLAQQNQELRELLAPPPNGPEIGQHVRAVPWQPVGGDESLLAFAGAQRERVLLIFTTDCPACKQNQRAWREVHERVAGASEVIGISLSGAQATRDYRDAFDLPFPVGVPLNPDEFAASLAIVGVPVTLRVGTDGRVLDRWTGTLSNEQIAEISAAGTG